MDEALEAREVVDVDQREMEYEGPRKVRENKPERGTVADQRGKGVVQTWLEFYCL